MNNPITENNPYHVSPEALSRLRALGKKYALTKNRGLLWLSAPILIIMAISFAVAHPGGGTFAFSIAWFFVVIFGLGIFIHVYLPSNEEISLQYKKIFVPEIIRMLGIQGDYSTGHMLSVESFLKSGLYRDPYSRFERTDCIIGSYQGIKFGLYELAVQVSSGLQGTPGMPSTSFLTNYFYGWVLHVPVRTFAGSTYILPRVRRTKGEADDWLDKVSRYHAESGEKTFVSGDTTFDNYYLVYTTNLPETEKILGEETRKLLVIAYNYSITAPAFSFTGTRAYMHVGIDDHGLELAPGQKIFPPQPELLQSKIGYFCTIIKGLYLAGGGKSLH